LHILNYHRPFEKSENLSFKTPGLNREISANTVNTRNTEKYQVTKAKTSRLASYPLNIEPAEPKVMNPSHMVYNSTQEFAFGVQPYLFI
jgi:hypothetical protein